MINFDDDDDDDDDTKENINKHNPNWTQILDQTYKIIGGSGSGKTN